AKHLIVALPLVLVGVAVRAVRLDPQAAVLIKAQAIRAIESVVFSDVVGARPQVASISVFDGVARQYEQIPLEGGSGSIIAGFTPAHDLAVKVGGARVCA